MQAITKGMDKAMQSMDMEKISAIMDKFEQQFEDLDVQSQYVENAMGQSVSLSTPAEEVDTLISQVAEEHGMLVGCFDIYLLDASIFLQVSS